MPNIFNLGNTEFGTADPLAASKFYNPRNFQYDATGTLVAATRYFGPMRKAGSWQRLEAAITEAIATGGDRTVTIDLLKSTGAGAYATVVSGSFQFTSASTLRLAVAATLADTSFAVGDTFKLTVTVAGGVGNQAQGLTVHLSGYEAP
jgi:hypothetical protein